MSRAGTLIAIGILAVLLPFLGFPFSWLSILYPLLGLAVLIVGFLIRAERTRAASHEAHPAT